MKLYIKQQVFSWKEKFDVYDEDGNTVYYVEGKVFSLSHQFSVYDIYGSKVATVDEKLFKLLSEYEITADNTIISLKKQFTFLRSRYSLLGTSWTLEGDVFDHNYQVLNSNGGPVMRLSKHWFTFGDSYELDISDEKDALLALCIALSIDADLCTQSN